jgi:bifunctional non-homologous end joining protein LigD
MLDWRPIKSAGWDSVIRFPHQPEFLPHLRLTVLDGEIVCVDKKGKPQFRDLLFRRGNPPCFFAFDLLTWDGKDLRTERLLDRKQELRRLLAGSPDSLLKYTEYIDGCGMALFERVCELDLEGIVAKQKFGPYVAEREYSTWFKILNREYSQKDGREELFERERHSEPVAGWQHSGLCRIRATEPLRVQI